MKNLKKNNVEMTLRYPTHLMPGEERFLQNGIEVGPFKGRLGVEIRCREIIVSSTVPNSLNYIEIQGTDSTQILPLHYFANNTLSIPNKKELGVFITTKKTNLLKLLILSALVLLFVLPSLILAFKASFLSLTFNWSDVIAVNIPFWVVISLLFTTKRLSLILKTILEYDINITIPEKAHGILDVIYIDNHDIRSNDNMSFDISV